jgi:hypothetical protein
MPALEKREKTMGGRRVNDCVVELEAVQEKSTYEIMRDLRVVELAERLKPVEAAKNDL